MEHLTGGRFTDISFSLNRGEILGVAGLMGAGRTEIMRAIFGLDPLTAGTSTMNGKVLRIRSSRDALDQGIGYVSEDRRSVGLVLGMTVRDNITMSNLSQYCRHSWIRHKEEKRVADEQIREFSIKTPSAATSRRSYFPRRFCVSRKSSFWMSRPAASTSAPRRRSTR